MEVDEYLIFTQCNRLYVQGVRRAIRQRLEKAYGDDWWDKGVTPALTQQQRQILEKTTARWSGPISETLLDVSHFAPIITTNPNYRLAFLDGFTDSAETFNRLRQLAAMRNDWAHVQDISGPRVMQAANSMKGILASLQCTEALELENMTKGFTVQTAQMEDYPDTQDDVAEPVNNLDPSEPIERPWELWQQFQSYLVLEKSVEIPQDDPEGDAIVTLRVRNATPDSGDWPGVHFNRVTLRSVGATTIGRSSRYEGQEYREFSNLEPGASFDAEFSFNPKALAAVEFELYGEIDTDQLFKFQRKTGLPGEVVAPLLDEFVNRFELLNIKDTLVNFVDALRNVNESTTLAEISALRNKLAEIPQHRENILTTLFSLLREFHFMGGSPLDRRCLEIKDLFIQFDSKVAELDTAISKADIVLIERSIRELEQLQLAILRVEDTIKGMTEG